MDQQRLLHQFIQRTGLELEAATSILGHTDWDLVESYRMFDNLVKVGKIKPVQPAMRSRLPGGPGMTFGQPSRSSSGMSPVPGSGMTTSQPSTAASIAHFPDRHLRPEMYPGQCRGPPSRQDRIIPIVVEKPRPLLQARTPPPMVKRPVSQQVPLQYRQAHSDRFPVVHMRKPVDSISNRFTGDQSRIAGEQNWYSGDESKLMGNHVRVLADHEEYPGNQGRFPGNQGRFPGDQGRFPGDQGKILENQSRFLGGQSKFPENQSKFPENQSRFLENQSRFAGHQGKFSENQSRFPGDQIMFSENQGRLSGDQCQFPGKQVRFPGDQCRFPGDQGRFQGDSRFPVDQVKLLKPQATSYEDMPSEYIPLSGVIEVNSRSDLMTSTPDKGSNKQGRLGTRQGPKVSAINIQGQNSATQTDSQVRSNTHVPIGRQQAGFVGPGQVQQQGQGSGVNSQQPSDIMQRASPSKSATSSGPRSQTSSVPRPVSDNEASISRSSTEVRSSEVKPAEEDQCSTANLETKSASVAPSSPRPLKRGFSKIVENESLVSATRNSLLHDIEEDSHNHMYVQTFVLPDLTVYSSDYRAFLEKDLIETSTLVSLEQAGRLNWWAEMGICQRLLPMATSGDGNCLLHAASLAMWGIHDRELMLRKALYDTLTRQSYSKALYRRWRWQQTQVNKESGLIFSEEEWQQEWKGILKLASTRPRSLPGMSRRSSSCCDSVITQGGETSAPVVYESLEEFHVFVLAHVLQRAIIVVADTILKDTRGEALAPIPFGGIYLPLEIESKSCHRSPLLLTYDAAHFSALVPMEKQSSPPDDKSALPVAVPLVGPELVLLPLHFVVDPGPGYDWSRTNSSSVNVCSTLEDRINLLQQFLDMDKLPVLCESDYDSDTRSTGSYESDENLGCIGKEKKRDSKMSQQIQNMTKQFGSLGKSMGKKLRKNFGSVGKAIKSMAPDSEKGKHVGGVTQSTKVPLTIAAMTEHEQTFIWCAGLSVSQSQTHKRMITNYLQDAEVRFKQDRELMRPSREEIRRRSLGTYANQLTKCVTSHCNMYGNPETCYLCSKCFSEQRLQALEKEKQSGSNSQPPDKVQDVQKCGKSIFYLSPDDAPDDMEAVIPTLSQSVPSQSVPSQLNKLHGISSRDRAPSPDYDNVDYKMSSMAAPNPSGRLSATNSIGSVPAPISSGHSSVPTNTGKSSAPLLVINTANKGTAGSSCRTPGCPFFGTESTQFYCSACYKNKTLSQKAGYIAT